MKTVYQEHLEAVADRNSRLYFDSEKDFKKYMDCLGWEEHEIDMMIKYIERKNGAK